MAEHLRHGKGVNNEHMHKEENREGCTGKVSNFFSQVCELAKFSYKVGRTEEYEINIFLTLLALVIQI
jgi:hypothetical protein